MKIIIERNQNESQASIPVAPNQLMLFSVADNILENHKVEELVANYA